MPEKRNFRRWIKIVLQLAVIAVVAWFVWDSLAGALEELRQHKFTWDVRPAWLAAAAAFFFVGNLPMGYFWYRSMQAMGQRPRLVQSLRAYLIGQVGKYVPGKAMVVVLRVDLVRGPEVDAGIAAVCVFVETLTIMAVGSFLAAAIMPFWLLDEAFQKYWYLLPLSLVLMAFAGLPTVPAVFRRLVRLVGVGKSDPEMNAKLAGIDARFLLRGWIMLAVGWLLWALSLWATLRALGIEEARPFAHLHFYLVAVTLSVVAGFLSMIPGGFGVRELVLIPILGEFYFTRVLVIASPDAAAVTAAIVLRLLWLVCEAALSVILYIGIRRGRDSITPSTPP